MTNDTTSDTNVGDAVPCFALSKNGQYAMSASGGRISLFNLVTFEVRDFPFMCCLLPIGLNTYKKPPHLQ